MAGWVAVPGSGKRVGSFISLATHFLYLSLRQGCIKRKTLIKDGRRPTISAWQRYWLQLWGSSLVFFSARSLTKGTDRRDFHSEPAKYQSIVGCLVMVSDSGSTLDNLSFQLTDPVRR